MPDGWWLGSVADDTVPCGTGLSLLQHSTYESDNIIWAKVYDLVADYFRFH